MTPVDEAVERVKAWLAWREDCRDTWTIDRVYDAGIDRPRKLLLGDLRALLSALELGRLDAEAGLHVEAEPGFEPPWQERMAEAEREAARHWGWRNWTRLGVANYLRRAGYNMETAIAKANEICGPVHPREAQSEATASHTKETPAPPTGEGGHASDCALHNAPALPVGPCDCGAGGVKL